MPSAVLVMLLRLRQICSHTSLITEEENVIIDDGADNTCDAKHKDDAVRAETLLGREFVVKIKEKLLKSARDRMAAEKDVSMH